VLVVGSTPVLAQPIPQRTVSTTAADEAAEALAKAADTGQRVEVAAERSQDTTVYANPDGSTFTLEQSAVPVRVATSDGGWRTPDATLVRRTDGTVTPKAAS
jgi:hypothetical protein